MNIKSPIKVAATVIAIGAAVWFGPTLGAQAAPSVHSVSQSVSTSASVHSIGVVNQIKPYHPKVGCRYVSVPPTQPWYLCLFYTNNMGPYGCYSHNVWTC
jgi:hypothetical protein